ncbi:MAG TPA: hypothetical protein VGT24_01515 [Candidatus Acidoferrales bacterium]|nr:hypothetical protein [Candidatus Acidoferrales bacterium]
MAALLGALSRVAEAEGNASLYNQDLQRQLNDPLRLAQIKEANLRLQELQKQMGREDLPAVKDVITLPDGSTAAVMIDPKSGQPTIKPLSTVDSNSYDSLAKQIIGGLPQPDQARAQDEYTLGKTARGPIGGIAALQSFVAKTPRVLKNDYSKIADGVITDTNGTSWLEGDKSAPPEIQAAFKTYEGVQSKKEAQKATDEVRRSDLSIQRAVKLFPLATQRALAVSATQNIKAQTGALLAARSTYQLMQAELPHAKAGDQQAMVALLTNHINMTLGRVKGGRVTRAFYEEAMQSAPWLARVAARFDGNGFLSGVTLTPDQMDQMMGLAKDTLSSQTDEAVQAMQMGQQFGLPVTQQQIDRIRAIGGMQGSAGTDLSDLGGKKQ